MEKAVLISATSDDPKGLVNPNSRVGCLIVKGSKTISKSANVLPKGVKALDFDLTAESENRYLVIEHAERAAIYKAANKRKRIKGATMYCTRFPCSDCARAIISTGITRLVVKSGIETNLITSSQFGWEDSQRIALLMLEKSKVKVDYLSPENIRDKTTEKSKNQ